MQDIRGSLLTWHQYSIDIDFHKNLHDNILPNGELSTIDAVSQSHDSSGEPIGVIMKVSTYLAVKSP